MNGKRLLCLLLALAVLTALLAVPAGAADMAFVAINDTIPLTLTGNDLPFYSGGTLYVPYTVFSQSSLGFYPSYIPGDSTLTLFSRSQRLVYNLNTGMVTDEDHSSQYLPTVIRGGTVFLPAVFSATHFGVGVSVLTSQAGYTVVRFTTGAQVYDDSLFIEKAENLIAYLADQQTADETPEETTPTTPPETVTPTPDPQPEEPEQTPAEILLAVVDASTMAGALDTLAQESLPAAFFLTADELAANGDLVRRIAAAGHTIGITVAPGEDAAEGLALANEALDRVLGRKTLLALVPESSSPESVTAQYSVFVRPDRRLTATEAAEAYGETRLLISDGEQLAAGLPILQEAGVTFSRLQETTVLP